MVRFKNRYFAVEINPEGKPNDYTLPLKASSLYNALIERVHHLHGDFGVAAVRAGFTAKYCNEKTRIAIIRARHGAHRIVASSMPFVTTIESKKVRLRTIYTGATLKQCFRYIQKHQRKCLSEMLVALSAKKTFGGQAEIMSLEQQMEITEAYLDLSPAMEVH